MDISQLKEDIQKNDHAYLESLILDAANSKESHNGWNLWQIHQALSEIDPLPELDPLTLLPALLWSEENDVFDMAIMVTHNASAKEVIVVLKEFGESISTIGEIGTDDDDVEESRKLLRPTHCALVICIYTEALSRIPVRKRSPSTILKDILPAIQSLIQAYEPHLTDREAINVLNALIDQLHDLAPWASLGDALLQKESTQCNRLLQELVITSIGYCQRHLKCSLSIEVFKVLEPRLSRAVTYNNNLRAKAVMSRVMESVTLVEASVPVIGVSTPVTVGSLILHVHRCLREGVAHTLQNWLSILLSCLTEGVAVDESIALLGLYAKECVGGRQRIPENISIPIIEILTPLASVSPDETTRLICFRLLSIFILFSPDALAAITLQELLIHPTFPQMRVAAISILKERVLEALEKREKSLFASPQLLSTFGSVLFRLDPPEILRRVSNDKGEMHTFLLSPEAKRLSECLGFYYVLFRRDQENRTSIRGPDVMKSIGNGLLKPVEYLLREYRDLGEGKQETGEVLVLHTIPHMLAEACTEPTLAISLMQLESSLERIKEAVHSFSV